MWALRRGHARSDVLAGALMTGALLKPQLAFPLAIIAVFCLVQGPDAWVRRRRVAMRPIRTCAGTPAVSFVTRRWRHRNTMGIGIPMPDLAASRPNRRGPGILSQLVRLDWNHPAINYVRSLTDRNTTTESFTCHRQDTAG